MAIKTPETNLIEATVGTKHIRDSFNLPRFQAAMATLASSLEAGKIWNQEFLNAKYYIAAGTEHAQHIAAESAMPREERRVLSSGDPRHDIGYAFGMNQAAKMSRRLKKLKGNDLTPGIQNYIATLDQIDAVCKWLKGFKAIIVKGRKPQIKTPEQIAEEIANIGTCCICGKGQKLEDNQTMVKHGYTMSEYNHSGYQIGSCFGVEFLPYEFSCEANEQWLANFLKPELKRRKSFLADMTASKFETLDRYKDVFDGQIKKVKQTFAKGTPEYADIRTNEIYRTEAAISELKQHIIHHTALITNWKLQPIADGTELKTK